MGPLWSLALSLLLCCWGVAGQACSEDASESAPAGRPPLQVPAPGPAGTIREAEDIAPSARPRALAEAPASRLRGSSAPPVGTAAARNWPVGTVPGSESPEAASRVLCTEDSSEELQAAPARGHRVASPGPTGPAGAPVLSTGTQEGTTHCDVIEIEAAPPRITPPSGPSPPEGRGAWSSPETAASPESSKAKSQPPRTTPTLENWSVVTATPSPPVAGPLPAQSTRAREGAAVHTSKPAGTLGTLSTSLLGETTDSEDPLDPTGASEAVGFPAEAGSAGARATAPAGSSVTWVYGVEWRDPTPSSSPPVRVPVDGKPFSPARSSSRPASTLAQSMASVNTWGQLQTAVPTSTPRKRTPGVFPGEGAGFLLLRLTVLSWENLLEPRVAERLMQQLPCELYAHMPVTEVSLLRVTRS